MPLGRPAHHVPPTVPGIAVLGASGGLGASSLALALGIALARSGPTVVADLDLAGGGLDVLAGIEHLPGARWGTGLGAGPQPGADQFEQLPGRDGCGVLSAGNAGTGRVSAAGVAEVLGGLAPRATLVLDVPRGSPHLPAALARAEQVLVLTALTAKGLSDLDAALAWLFGSVEVRAGGVPRALPSVRLLTTGARPPAALPDALTVHTGCGYAGHLPRDDRLARATDHGEWPGSGRGALRTLAEQLIAALAQREAA